MANPPLPTHTALAARLRASGCVFAEDEASLLLAETTSPAKLEAMVQQRVDGLPLEYVVGWAEFCGRRIIIEPGVFVPRHRSEFLVEQAIIITKPGAIVADICCGSGALGLVVVAHVAHVQLHSADIEPAAVHCARLNLAPLDAGVYEGDLFAALPNTLTGTINTLIANVPYVPTAAIELLPREARLYEPAVTLDGGSDGLGIMCRVAAQAEAWLAPGGHVLVEVAADQAETAAKLFRDGNLKPKIVTHHDQAATVIIATK